MRTIRWLGGFEKGKKEYFVQLRVRFVHLAGFGVNLSFCLNVYRLQAE